jgi:hypothetical protein
MGLILCGALLVLFYIAKIFFPEFIVGVAEIPSIVKFGNYVDTHKWANHCFNIASLLLFGYIYVCACARTYKLDGKSWIIFVAYVILLSIASEFMVEQYTAINYVCLILVPFLICFFNKSLSKDTFISTAICFSVDILTQVMSLAIRDIIFYSTKLNSATFFILLIDALIWRLLLYCYFNYKGDR